MTTTVSEFHGSLGAATIVDIQWRVDVVLSSLSELDQVAVPVALLSVRWSNHVVLTFWLKPEDLHQWRFALAKGLRDMLYLEKKQPAHNARRK